MASILAVLQIVVCVFLILLIMIQDPKGGSSGLFSGGNSNSLLGAGGGADFLTKLTRYVAILFGALCIGLTIVTKPAKTGVFSKGAIPAAIEQSKTANPPAAPSPAAPTTESTTPANKPADKK